MRYYRPRYRGIRFGIDDRSLAVAFNEAKELRTAFQIMENHAGKIWAFLNEYRKKGGDNPKIMKAIDAIQKFDRGKNQISQIANTVMFLIQEGIDEEKRG